MAKRERYTQDLKCPECGRLGKGKFEENETPPHHGGAFDTRIISLSKGFRAGTGEGEVICEKCQTKVPH